jgi:hypothetical protein
MFVTLPSPPKNVTNARLVDHSPTHHPQTLDPKYHYGIADCSNMDGMQNVLNAASESSSLLTS